MASDPSTVIRKATRLLAAQATRHLHLSITAADFRAYLPSHLYIFMPTGDLWPSASVNSQLPDVVIVDDDGHAVLGDDNQPIVLKATAWLDKHHPVHQMTWCPGEPAVIHGRLVSDGGWITRQDAACFNLYRPPVPSLGNAADVALWKTHVERIYGDDAPHLFAWFAHRAQHPEQKINHALVLGGKQGIGKDSILEPIKYAVGPWNFADVSPTHMMGRFNGFLKSVILRVNEARDLGDLDRYSFYDHMKVYTAAPPDVLRVDEKHIKDYTIFNVCGVIITTNRKTDGIYLDPDDRRHYVAWSDASKEDFTPAYWQQLWDWLDAGGRANVTAWLRAYDLSTFNAKAPPPKTDAWKDIVDANRAPEDAELADAIERLGTPDALTIGDFLTEATPRTLRDFLTDRKNSRAIPYRLHSCGYEAARAPHRKDGLWIVEGTRQVVYALSTLPKADRLRAAAGVAGHYSESF